MLYDPIEVIWKEKTPFEATTGRIVFICPSSGFGFPGCFLARKVNARSSVNCPLFHLIVNLISVIDMALGQSGHWLETRAGTGGTATLS